MSWLEFSHWMSGSECADFWANLLHQSNDSAYKQREAQGLGANTVVGFGIAYGADCAESAVNMFLIDPLRFGEGFGSASAGGSKWGVVSDVGRGLTFVPIGKLGVAALRSAGADLKALSTSVRAAVNDARAVTTTAGAGRAAAGAESQIVRPGMDALGQAGPVVPNPAAAPAVNGIKGLFTIADPDASKGLCTWVSLLRALHKAGRYYMSVDDLIQLTLGRGATVADLEMARPTYLTELQQIFQRLGIRVMQIANDSLRGATVEEKLTEGLGRMGNRDGVALFSVQYRRIVRPAVPPVPAPPGPLKFFAKPPTGTPAQTEAAAHTMFCRMEQGRLTIFDRSGRTVHSLVELEPQYPGISAGYLTNGDRMMFIPSARRIDEAAYAANTYLRYPGFQGLGPLAVPVQLFPAVLNVH